MKTHPKLRKQLIEYERAGFHVKEIDPSRGRGAHLKVVFEEFNAPQFLTPNMGDPRAIRNNIANFKRLTTQEKTNAS